MATKNNPYLFKIPPVKIIVGRVDWVLQRCKGKKVLHLGCVDEGLIKNRFEKKTLMHIRLSEVARVVWGLDTDMDGIRFLREKGVNNLVCGDAEQIEKVREFKGQDFDVILASEIIEHLNNPGLFLQGVKGLCSPNTEVIITVPSCFRLTGLSYKLKGYEFIHYNHNFWFSYKTLLNLLEKNGYVVNEVLAYSFLNYKASLWGGLINRLKSWIQNQRTWKRRADLISPENTNNQTGIVGVTRLASAILFRKVLYRLNPLFADGIIVVAKPKEIG